VIISNSYKFVFIKTRKVAGSSIERVILPHLTEKDVYTGFRTKEEHILPINFKEGYNLSHMSWADVKERYPKAFKRYFKFTVERNPWDKLVSYFFYYNHFKPHTTKKGFKTWLKSRGHEYSDWFRYADNDTIVVDRVLQYENLHEEMVQLAKDCIVPYKGELKRTRVLGGLRKNANYRSMYDSETENLVRVLFRKEINYFNYKF